jgi:predicted transcriptional regulator of viral defense system
VDHAWKVEHTGDDKGSTDRRLAALAARQWGVVSARELEACGLSRSAIAHRVRTGRLHRMHRGVFAVGHASPPLEGRFLAAVKACGPYAVLSHRSAAAVHGIVEWEERHPEVTVPAAQRRSHPGIRVHRSHSLTARDATRHGPLLLTSPERTLQDLAKVLTVDALRRALRHAQALRLTTHERLAARGLVTTGAAPTRSALEDALLDLILDAGLAHPDVNVPLHFDGRTVIPDFRWPAQRLIVEADGAAAHDNPLARREDAARQALLEAGGERVVRVTWAQVTARRAETLARLQAAGAPAAGTSRTPAGTGARGP